MGGTRITQGMIIDRTLRNLNAQLRQLATVQDQLATGSRVNRPSDDPLAARSAVNTRTLIAQQEQFLSNMTDIQPHLTESNTTLQRGVDILQRARELTIQGANETNGQSQLDSIALEINELLESMVVAGNHETNGRFIFAGTRTLNRPFVETRVAGDITAVAYQGNTNDLDVAIAENTTVTVNVDGVDAFQNSVDIFATLIGIRDDLRSGNQAALQTTRLDELDSGLEQLLLSESTLGAVENRLTRVSGNTEEAIVSLRILLSDKIDVDFAEATLDFNNAISSFESALNASARVMQPTLLDFLR